MSTHILSNTGDWKLRFEDSQDIRGYTVLNQDGTDLGLTVDDLVIDTEAERVTIVRLSDGSEYPARDISIGDGVIYVTGDYDVNDPSLRRASDIEHFGVVEMRKDRPLYSDAVAKEADADFRSHCATTYPDQDFDLYVVAYQFGHERAHDDTYRNRSFADSESDLRRDYEDRFPERNYDADLDAVRFGYSRAQRGSFAGRSPMINT
jgi:sporulation protein YlmC with PRC-barrel domain